MLASDDGIGEWGFSAVVDVDGHRILFDTGDRPETVLNNAKELHVDLTNITDVVLSHSHHDHTGGLMTLRRALMREIERRAAQEGRWLLTLDTAGDAAEALYRSLGYSLAGTIPHYARDAFEDRYEATRLMYKDLRHG